MAKSLRIGEILWPLLLNGKPSSSCGWKVSTPHKICEKHKIHVLK